MAANGSAVQFFYALETAPGVINPTTPEFKPIRFNTSSLSRNVAQVDSEEINQNRQRPVARQGTYSTQGEITSELSIGTFDELLAIALQSEWSSNTLKVGKDVKTISILKRHTDTNEDVIYRGCRVNTVAINSQIDARVIATFGVIGTEAESFEVPVGATYAPVTTSEPMVTSVGEIREGGIVLLHANAADFTINNGMDPIFALHNRAAYDVENGMFTASGTLSAYRKDGELYDKFLNETETTIEQTFQETAAGTKKLTFKFPKVLYTQSDDAVNGPGVLNNSYTWSAGYDSVAATTLTVTRTP